MDEQPIIVPTDIATPGSMDADPMARTRSPENYAERRDRVLRLLKVSGIPQRRAAIAASMGTDEVNHFLRGRKIFSEAKTQALVEAIHALSTKGNAHGLQHHRGSQC